MQESDVTQLLAQYRQGDQAALNAAMTSVYEELRRVARGMMRQERPNHTLQATALLHEALLKLGGQSPAALANRSQLVSIGAMLMRRILVDVARARLAAKRGEGKVDADWTMVLQASVDDRQVIEMSEALERLAKKDERSAKAIELRYFGGFEVQEISETLGVSLATVKRDLQYGKAWLRSEIAGEQ
jgi:RNA polymerase sigma factor (TIGR02999 family)